MPAFPLNSKPDENILRVCSYIRRDVYDAASLNKENASRDEIIAVTPSNLFAKGPIRLPRPTPDIDLLIRDDASSTLFICELKWIRKPAIALEHQMRDADFYKGVRQLKSIHAFLTANSQHLQRLGFIHPHLKYTIQYVLVARDHFKWIAPETGIVLVDYDVFKAEIAKASDLQSTVHELLRFQWLPIEERDFVVRGEYAVSNGVFVETENFYSPSGASNPFPIIP